MGFGRGVQSGLHSKGREPVLDRSREVCRQRQRESAEVSFVAAAGEGAVEWLRPSEAFADPAQGFGFDLRCQLGTRHGGQLRIQRRHQHFRENGGISRGGIHQTKVVGRRNMESLIDELPGCITEELRERVLGSARERCVGSEIGERSPFRHGFVQWNKAALFQRRPGPGARAATRNKHRLCRSVRNRVGGVWVSPDRRSREALGDCTKRSHRCWPCVAGSAAQQRPAPSRRQVAVSLGRL